MVNDRVGVKESAYKAKTKYGCGNLLDILSIIFYITYILSNSFIVKEKTKYK